MKWLFVVAVLLVGCGNQRVVESKPIPAPCDSVLFYPQQGGYIAERKNDPATKKLFVVPEYRDPYQSAWDYAERLCKEGA